MTFKIDENLPNEFVEVLNAHGHKAFSVKTQGLGGRSDSDIAIVIEQDQYVFVTLDRGFSNIRTYPPERFARLVNLRVDKHDKPLLIDLLIRTIPSFDIDPLTS